MIEKSLDQPPMSPIMDVLADLQATSRWQERVYKQLHAHPELSFQETETAALAASKLKELGYEVLEGIGRTVVVGVLRNGEGRSVLARADMDALPVKENTGLPYASTLTAADPDGQTVNVAHACGPDAHVTCLLGAAELLARARESWGGTFIALFQPAEECHPIYRRGTLECARRQGRRGVRQLQDGIISGGGLRRGHLRGDLHCTQRTRYQFHGYVKPVPRKD
jgi:metal-dependent amidase/aminoacylase/carboxypeptidase family protein